MRLPFPPRRARTPTMLQMEAVECGAAALGIILGYHGRIVPLEELRVECGVSRDGSKAINVVRAARRYGLEAKGYRYEVDAVRQLAAPFIVFWNFNHFLVVEGFAGDRVYLNDPAEGPRTVSAEEFDQAYTGVVLAFSPGPDFRRGGRKPSLIAALVARVRGSEGAVLYATIASLALVATGLVIPVFSQVFVDKVLINRQQQWFMPLLVGMTLTAVLRGALSWARRYYALRLETKLAVSLSSKFLWHLLRLPIVFFTQRYGAEIGFRVETNDRIATFLAARLANTAIDAGLVILYAALMFAYDWQLTLVGLSAVGILLLATALVNRARVDGNRRMMQEEAKATSTLLSGLIGIESLKASGLESDLFARWSGYQAKYINAQQQLSAVSQVFLSVPPLIITITNVIVLSLGALHVMSGQLTMGMLVAFQSLMASFLTPVNSLVQLAGELQTMEGSMNRIDDVLRHPFDPGIIGDDESSGDDGGQLAGALELRDVAFGYSRLDPPLIDGLSLSLAPGRRVALVGASGSGKSTVAKLITGMYEPWSGEIRFDGHARNELPRRALTNSVALVDQDITLFAGTVRENVALWDATIPEPQLVAACRDASIHEDIAGRQGGYDGVVDESGRNFSGGQRQRLEIARALAGNPRILVLDEATSALDALTEERVSRSLKRRGCTCVIIAHRLSTIRDADEIIMLERGKVVARGTHDELMAGGGAYATLVQQT